MASGIKVSDKLVSLCENMNLKPKGAEKHRWLVIEITKNNSIMECEESKVCSDTRDTPGPSADEYVEFLAMLESIKDKKQCRYILYDFPYMDKSKVEDGQYAEKLILVTWCPDTSPVKEKMIYGSSKAALSKKLKGAVTEVQANDLDDLDYDTIVTKLGGKKKV